MRYLCVLFGLLSIFLFPSSALCQITPVGQQSSDLGWLEGTILTNEGHVVNESLITVGNKRIHGVRHGGGEFDATTDAQLGGLYSVSNLRPGIYDLTVDKGWIGGTTYSPQRIYGIVIKPGVRTIVNVVMNQGEQLEEIGSPVVVTTVAVPVSLQLTQLQEQVAALKQQIDSLKQQVADLQAKPPRTP